MKLIKDKYFWILLILSLSLRIYAWYATPIIGRDGLDFIGMAKHFFEGNFLPGLGYPFHPLYPLLITLGSLCGLEFEHAGKIVSLVLGIFTIISLYIIGKKMFTKTIAFIAAFLLAIHPYATRLSVDVMSDPAYFFFYVTGFGLGYAAINRQKPYLFFLAGIASSLAYLTRPEGISVMLITGMWILINLLIPLPISQSNIDNNITQDSIRVRISIKRSIKYITFLLIGFLILSFPYILYIKSETGTWRLSKKKSLSNVTGVSIILDEKNKLDLANHPAVRHLNESETLSEKNNGNDMLPERNLNLTQTFTPEEVAILKRKSETTLISSFSKLITQYFDSLHYPLLLFLIIGIVSTIFKNNKNFSNRYILSYIIIFIFVLFFLQKTVGYVSYRHLMNIVFVTLFWAAIGVNQSYYWVMNKSSKYRNGKKSLITKGVKINTDINSDKLSFYSTRSFIIFLCLIAALILPKTLKPHRKDKVVRKEAGLWLKEHHNDNAAMTILTDRLIVAFYADAKGMQIPKSVLTYDEIVKFAKSSGADYLAATENIENSTPNFFEKVINNDLKKLIELKKSRKKVVIYEIIKDLDNNILDDWNTTTKKR